MRRKLARHGNVGQELDAPAIELGAIAQVQIFGEGVGPPAARIFDAGSPPDSGGAVEVEEQAAARSRRLLDDEMAVYAKRLQLGEE